MLDTLKLLLQRNSDEIIIQNVPLEVLRDMYEKEMGEAGTDARTMLSVLRKKCQQSTEPLIGMHQSFTGLRTLWSNTEYYGNNTFQCFLRNNRNLKRRDILYDDIVFFNICAKKMANPTFAIHAPYVMNPASCEEEKRKRAVDLVREDVRIVEKLFGNGYYVLHPGAWTDYSRVASTEMLIKSMRELEDLQPGILCLETMAGQGTQHLRDLESISYILDACMNVNLCVDTCHIWAAGISFDAFLSFAEAYAERIKVIHVNDSQTVFNSHVDRHENIGYGKIPEEDLKRFLLRMHAISPGAPMILETPADRTDMSLYILKEMFSKENEETTQRAFNLRESL